MEKVTAKSILNDLKAKGVTFEVTHAAPTGARSATLSLSEVLAYLADPDAGLAMHYGVTPRDFRGWIDSGFSVRCHSATARGKQCKGAALGMHQIDDPSQWVKASAAGGYCWTHSERN